MSKFFTVLFEVLLSANVAQRQTLSAKTGGAPPAGALRWLGVSSLGRGAVEPRGHTSFPKAPS